MWKLAAGAALVAIFGMVILNSGGSSPPASAGITLPPAGIDDFEINGQVTIDLPFTDLGPEKVLLTGTMSMLRDDPSPEGTIDIEIVALSLTGDSNLLGGPTLVVLELNPSAPPSTGLIDASSGFPAESFFDIQFMDVYIGDFAHFLNQPVQMFSPITGIPPYGDKFGYSKKLGNPIIDNLPPNDQVGSLLDLNIDIKPPVKTYSITVLKRHDGTKAALPGWKMNLYVGSGCAGDPIDNGTTGADGTVKFGGLAAGTYSVKETLQPGWNNVTPLCQDTTVPEAVGGSEAGVPACPFQPDLPFPDAGCDQFNSAATVQVEFTNPPTIDPLECDLGGPTLITRSAVIPGALDRIDTEIVAMDLTGLCDPGSIFVTARVSPDRRSLGQITEQANTNPGTLEFEADSFFDVFFEIDTPLGTLHNQDPMHLSCKISEIPPYGCLYEPDVGVIPLFDVTGKEAATMLHAVHIPLDPKQKLLIFSNLPKETPTPTPTPSEQLYSIAVLKRNDDTKETLPGWKMNLYLGSDCTGDPIDNRTTGADGMAKFGGLVAGTYSVEEKLQSGWNNVTPLCQNTTVPAAVGGIVAGFTCPIQPDLAFPAPGCDQFNSAATVQVEFTNPSTVPPLECDLSGPTLITRGPVVSKPPDSIDTEIVAMDLTGICQPGNIFVTVRESSTQDSTGRIVEQADSEQGVLEFKANSFFDVFFEIDTPLGTLHNQDPMRLTCKIQDIPPYGCLYEPDVGTITLYNADKKVVGTLLHAAHIPLDPKQKLLIFSNVPKAPVTPTPTTPGEPTATPTPTATEPGVVPTATPTRPPTPTPVPGDGDANKDGTTNAIDAALVLQYTAGFIGLPPNSDTNRNGTTDAIDAALILQFVAGFLSRLPV